MKQPQVRINYMIRANEVRVIGSDGEQIGIMPVPKAIGIAQSEGLDLVEVSPNSKPPVCRIVDYGKFKFDQSKRLKKAKKKQKIIKVKEIKMGPNIDEHDYQFKLKHIVNFLLEECKVRVVVAFQGRQMMHQDIGRTLMNHIIEDTKGTGIIEQMPKMEGRQLAMLLTLDPSKRQELKKGDLKSAETKDS